MVRGRDIKFDREAINAINVNLFVTLMITSVHPQNKLLEGSGT